ncbi:MAG: cell division protein FtsZ [Hymenobacteraceae bacterium]|nr:cell division protein FtsZ [Hymenobacteraceae bacterium]
MASSYKFDIPTQGRSIIKVIGVGGGGSNAVNHMFKQGIKDVEFVVCNTDKQALLASPVPTKMSIGDNLTEGLGAGANPERGRAAALESKEEIRELLNQGTKMVFITAGMGGGTGTGAAPVIAQVARELGILTVGIVTAPDRFAGPKKREAAEKGIREMSENCDTVLVILNEKIKEMYGAMAVRAAFAKANSVLTTAAKSIAEIITVNAEVNVDFEDVKTVMKDSGAAVMGSAVTEGENRARRAAEEALSSPLLNNTDIFGAQRILLSIMSGEDAELEMDELDEITLFIQEKAGEGADVIFGHGIDPELGSSIRVTVIATGFTRDASVLSTPASTAGRVAAPQMDVYPFAANPSPLEMAQQTMQPVTLSSPAVGEAPALTTAVTSTVPTAAEAAVPAPVDEPTRITYGLDHPVPAAAELPAQPTRSGPAAEPTIVRRPGGGQSDEVRFAAQSEDRRRRLRELSAGTDVTSEEFKQQMEQPAYLRRHVALDQTVPSAERKISRFSLSDDNELLGDNRYLHDNVD